jgi:hypothetical protein
MITSGVEKSWFEWRQGTDLTGIIFSGNKDIHQSKTPNYGKEHT